MVQVKMGEVDGRNAVRVHAQSGKAVLELPAPKSEARIEQYVLAIDLHEERAYAGRDAVGHVQAVVERVARIAEERARHQFIAVVVLNPCDRRAVCEGYSFRALDLCGGFSTRSFRGGGFLGGLGVAAAGNRECQRERAERDKKLAHGASCMVEYIITFLSFIP